MSPVVANGCVTPEATTTWRCREVPVFGLCICGRKLCQRPTLTLKVTQNNNMMNSRRILGCTYDSDAYCFFVSSWITAARFQQRRKEQLGFYQWMVFSWPQRFSCEILLRQQSVEEQVDQPKHDSQCLLEKQCGIKIKSSSESEWRWVAFTTSGCYWCQAADCPLQSTWHQALTRHLQAFSYSL